MLIERLNEAVLRVTVDKALYSEEVVYKCFYWYGDAFSISIEKEENTHQITLGKLNGSITEEGFAHLLSKIKNDLVDYKTREIIHKETKNIKEILIAKAFSSFDSYDEHPKGDIEDPVGFKIE